MGRPAAVSPVALIDAARWGDFAAADPPPSSSSPYLQASPAQGVGRTRGRDRLLAARATRAALVVLFTHEDPRGYAPERHQVRSSRTPRRHRPFAEGSVAVPRERQRWGSSTAGVPLLR